MAKRRKTIRAGRTVYDVVYTVPNPRDTEHVRKKIKQISHRAVELTNCTTATRKLELKMATNYAPHDLIITLTYGEWALPSTYDEALKRLQKLLRELRAHRKKRGQELRYIYVTEGRHGDSRVHHHVIINATENDLEVIRSLWSHGDQIDLRHIYDKTEYGESGYSGWASYLSKERREAPLNGKRMFTPSANIKSPSVEYEWVDDALTVEAPPGATDVVESSDHNEWASFKYVKYTVPRERPQSKKAAALKSGLRSTVTSRKRLPKVPPPDRQEGKQRVY